MTGDLRLRWPPLDRDFVDSFKSAGQNYTKAMPPADEVLVVDFFAGAGGMTCGFQSTRQSSLLFKHLGAVDIDAQALQTLSANMDIPTYNLDVRELAAHPESLSLRIPELARRTRSQKLVFIGCPPCQGFSAHRKKDSRDDPRNSLIMSFADLAKYFKPDVLVMENVPEMLKGRYQRYYEAAAIRLKEAGYNLTEDIVDMSLYGVPQKRRRAVVMGSLTGRLAIPDPVLAGNEVRTVRDAIAHLPSLPAGGIDERDPWHRAPAHIERIVEKIRRIPPDGGDRRQLPAEDQLACHVDMDAGRTPGFTDVYGRLRWDTPSVTITAKSSTPSCGRFLHPEQHRNITVREAALLQTFPHNYVFTGGFVGQYRQIGEAVPPLFARHLAFAVLNHLRPSAPRISMIREAIRSVVESDSGSSATAARVGAVDLFCGAGGLSLGLEAAGIPTLFAADSDGTAVETFQKNIGPQAAQGDVRDEQLITQIAEAVRERPYILVGGPPCQGFSQQRRGEDKDARNDLVLRYGEIAAALPHRPLAVVLENVMYLDSPRGRAILKKYLLGLRRLGYSARRFEFNSANFGLPQTRNRIVVVAVLPEYAATFVDPQPVTPGRWTSLGETLVGLPPATTKEIANHVGSRESELNVRRMAYVDMGRGRTAIPPELQMKCHRGYDGHLDVYGRLDWFGYARTITGGFDSSSRGEYTHPFLNRSITAREAARLQGFPDSFRFVGNKAEVRRQIGNAVPPPLGFAIGEAILKTFGMI